MEREYRIIDYNEVWFLEELESPGVWKILQEYKTKEEAISKLKEKEENGKAR